MKQTTLKVYAKKCNSFTEKLRSKSVLVKPNAKNEQTRKPKAINILKFVFISN